MTRLTKEIKEIICENALSQSSVSKALADNKQKRAELGLEIYNDNVTDKQTKEAKRIAQRVDLLPFCLPFGLFRHRNYITCSFGGMIDYLELPENEEFYELPRVNYAAEHEFSKRFMMLEQEVNNLRGQEDNIKNEIMAILNSCSTLEKLLKVWPEASNFLDGVNYTSPSACLPTVLIKDLNKKLGINSIDE